MGNDQGRAGDAAPGAGVSRRKLLGSGAVAGAVAGVMSASAARAQRPSGARDPNEGRPFKGFVVNPGQGGETVDLRLRALGPRDVLVRSHASITTYTMTRLAFKEAPIGPPVVPQNPPRLVVPGQGCVGVVEAIGPMVKRCLLYTSPSPRDGLLSR